MDSPGRNLPQINSIWIDEDQDCEKLYGLQREIYMSDENEELRIMMLNSAIPILPHRNNIDLPLVLGSEPLTPETEHSFSPIRQRSESPCQMTPKKSGRFKESLINSRLYRLIKDTRDSKLTRSRSLNSISSPFDFQHISHANRNESPEPTTPTKSPYQTSIHKFAQTSNVRKLSSAFVTEPQTPTLSIKSERFQSCYYENEDVNSYDDQEEVEISDDIRISNGTYMTLDSTDCGLEDLLNYTFPTTIDETNRDITK